jgi:hypothetical protein
MKVRIPRRLAGLLAAAVLLAGCGGDGLDFSSLQGHVAATSFIGYAVAPGIGGGGPPIPTIWRDEALLITFDKPLDDGTLGGFAMQGGVPLELLGTPAAGSSGVPYRPFADQDAARDSIQIRKNVMDGPSFFPYVVGRHRDRPDTIVLDPRVPIGNPLGLPPGAGFAALTEYVVIIPAVNGFRFGGFSAAAFGPDVATLPIAVPPFSTQPALSQLFRTGFAFGPDPIPPEVVLIDAVSGAAGTAADPVDAAGSFVVAFTKPVTAASLDPLRNFVIRNVDVTTPAAPQGILVAGSISPLTPGATADLIWIFTPALPYGPGPSPSEGFDIEVRIGTFGVVGVPPILGLPLGASGTQLLLANSLSRTFRTTPCNGCPTPMTLVEGFDDSSHHDTSFVQSFGQLQARWNSPGALGSLAGRFTSGTPDGATPAGLGTRIQFVVDPMPPSTNPAGLFSPFDASLANSGGQCPGTPSGCNLGATVNPNGGSHIMHVYEAAELGNLEDSLEQIEWSPVGDTVSASVYPQYSIWCGLTSTAAPIGGGGGNGLAAVFDANYNLTPYQAGIPIPAVCAAPAAVNPRKVNCGGPTPYVVPVQTTQFVPFPRLSPAFDFATAAGQSGTGVNLLFEQNVEPGLQVPNFNRYRALNFTPVRRLVDKPLSFVPANLCAFNNGGTDDIYRARFTFVGIVGQARSLWYDTGVDDPDYLNVSFNPTLASQPFGTQSTWILEGTDTPNPSPGTIGISGTYVDAFGTVHPNVLSSTLAGKRYLRFRVELRGNSFNNTTPVYTSLVVAYTP